MIMDPVTLGSIISAGAGLAGSAVSGIASGKMNKKSIKFKEGAEAPDGDAGEGAEAEDGEEPACPTEEAPCIARAGLIPAARRRAF